MKVYADTSFVAALYLQQQSSTLAVEFMQAHACPLPFTPWHRLEVRNALRLTVFHRVIDSRQARIQLRQLDADLQAELLVIHTSLDWVAVLREAEKLGAAHNETLGCRSGDLFHVAAAVHIGAKIFLTFDERQKKMALAAGLSVKP